MICKPFWWKKWVGREQSVGKREEKKTKCWQRKKGQEGQEQGEAGGKDEIFIHGKSRSGLRKARSWVQEAAL